MQHPKPGRRSQRPPHALPPDQDQRDRKEIWEDKFHSGLVRLGGRETVSPARARFDTQWYKNVLKNPQIRIDTRSAEAELRAEPITNAKGVKSVVEKFREKYGAGDVKKYYSKFDTALVAELG